MNVVLLQKLFLLDLLICFRLFGNGLFLCLFIISLMRLEISLRPFHFQSHDHKVLSIVFMILTVAVAPVEITLRLLVQGHAFDCVTLMLVRSLYDGQKITSSEHQECIQVITCKEAKWIIVSLILFMGKSWKRLFIPAIKSPGCY